MNRKTQPIFIKSPSILLLKRLFLGLLIYIATSSPSILSSQGISDNFSLAVQDPLQIVTTISIPADLVHNIAGDHAQVISIVSGATDIHEYPGPDTTQMQQIANADLFVVMGLSGLEPWLADTLSTLGSNAPPTLSLIEPNMLHPDPIINNALNPHVWMDPQNAKLMSAKITDKLIALDPAHNTDYILNNATYQSQLDRLLDDIASNRTVFEGLKVIIWHPAFTPLFNLLGINQTAAIERVEGEEPSMAYLVEIMQMMQRENISLIVTEQQSVLENVYTFARDAKAQVALLSPLLGVTDQNGHTIETYIEMIRYNLWALAHPLDPPKEKWIANYPLTLFLGLVAGLSWVLSLRTHSAMFRKSTYKKIPK